LDEAKARELIHGYCASVSYLDAQVGRVLDSLDGLGLRENTLVVLLADHGWQLGEHGFWSKHTLYEKALHCPLIFSGPGVAKGRRAPGLVEYVDVYPTLCEAGGLPLPPHLQGNSFLPLVKNPDKPGKEAVFSRHGTGDSIKTDRYRYSEWRDPSGKVTARMLYDHVSDPEENTNIAEAPSSAKVVADLSRRLADQIAHTS
jgi:arylsulfatase A-like enzyme